MRNRKLEFYEALANLIREFKLEKSPQFKTLEFKCIFEIADNEDIKFFKEILIVG